MRLFIIRFCCFVGILWGLLWGLQLIIENGLRHSKHNETWLCKVEDSTYNADLLFVGSSRAKVQYNPRIYDSILHTNSYNLGVIAWPLEMQRTIFELYARRNTYPKYIIFNVDIHLLYKKYGTSYYSNFLLYLNDTLLTRRLKQYPEALKWQDYYIPMYKWTNENTLTAEGFKSFFNLSGKAADTLVYKGYYPQHLSWKQATLDKWKRIHPKGERTLIDQLAKRMFEGWLAECRKHGTKVIFVELPIYYEAYDMELNKDVYKEYYTHLADSLHIPYLNYNTDSTRYKKEYYIDPTHFNSRTADYYSRKIALEIKNRRLLE